MGVDFLFGVWLPPGSCLFGPTLLDPLRVKAELLEGVEPVVVLINNHRSVLNGLFGG